MGFASQKDIRFQVLRPMPARPGDGKEQPPKKTVTVQESIRRRGRTELSSFVAAVKCESGSIRIVLLAERAEGMLGGRARGRNGEVTRSDGGEWEQSRNWRHEARCDLASQQPLLHALASVRFQAASCECP